MRSRTRKVLNKRRGTKKQTKSNRFSRLKSGSGRRPDIVRPYLPSKATPFIDHAKLEAAKDAAAKTAVVEAIALHKASDHRDPTSSIVPDKIADAARLKAERDFITRATAPRSIRKERMVSAIMHGDEIPYRSVDYTPSTDRSVINHLLYQYAHAVSAHEKNKLADQIIRTHEFLTFVTREREYYLGRKRINAKLYKVETEYTDGLSEGMVYLRTVLAGNEPAFRAFVRERYPIIMRDDAAAAAATRVAPSAATRVAPSAAAAAATSAAAENEPW